MQDTRRRPRLWREDELDHPWFHVEELMDVLRQAEARAQAIRTAEAQLRRTTEAQLNRTAEAQLRARCAARTSR
jgi:hypothetical protein